MAATRADLQAETTPPKRKPGRPPILESPEQMIERAEKYFDECDEGRTIEKVTKKGIEFLTVPIPYTVPGLALALGFNHREALRDYESKEGYSLTIKALRSRIERQRVEKMLTGEQSTIGSIFDLKCNFNYIDTPQPDVDVPHLTSGDVGSLKELAQAWSDYKRKKLNDQPQDKAPSKAPLTPGKQAQPQDAGCLPVFHEGELVTSGQVVDIPTDDE